MNGVAVVVFLVSLVGPSSPSSLISIIKMGSVLYMTDSVLQVRKTDCAEQVYVEFCSQDSYHCIETGMFFVICSNNQHPPP